MKQPRKRTCHLERFETAKNEGRVVWKFGSKVVYVIGGCAANSHTISKFVGLTMGPLRLAVGTASG